MPKFRKKPVVIEAMQWTGENANAIVDWAQGGWKGATDLDGSHGGIWLKQRVIEGTDEAVFTLIIPTLEGDHEARIGDWIIIGVKGEIYPCKSDIFAATYDPAD